MENSPSGCEDRILAMAALTLEAQAQGEAALVSDWDEARFRSVRISDIATTLGPRRVAQAAGDVTRALGPASRSPQPGYGAAVDTLSLVINKLL